MGVSKFKKGNPLEPDLAAALAKQPFSGLDGQNPVNH
jgi:hypothetical protein